MCARLPGTMRRSSPTSAFPVAMMRFSPVRVRGISDTPVCRPLRDHSVSPWRMMKTRGSGIAETSLVEVFGVWKRGLQRHRKRNVNTNNEKSCGCERKTCRYDVGRGYGGVAPARVPDRPTIWVRDLGPHGVVSIRHLFRQDDAGRY
jgi:hypothetical protein